MGEPLDIKRQWWMEALSLQSQGNFSGALMAYKRILSRNQDDADAWSNLGNILMELGRMEEAQDACLTALRLQPDHALAHHTMGHLYQELRRFDEALQHHKQAVDKDPESVVTLSGLAGLLARTGRPEEALTLERRALALEPSRAELHLNHGYSLMRTLKLEAAETSLLRALECEPGMARARWNLAYTRMLQGRFSEAWPDFSCRMDTPEGKANLKCFEQPHWDGKPFPDRTLFLWVEQGYGDSIQFVRYLPMVKALGGRIVLETYEPLRALLCGLPGLDELVLDAEQPSAFDFQAPLLELPGLLGTTLESVPCTVPYLHAPAESTYRPRSELVALLHSSLSGPRIGLSWKGNPGHSDDHLRSLKASQLKPLGQLPGVTWFSLQVGEAEQPSLPGLRDLGPVLHDFSDTAYALSQLDLLISVDTAVAHLAGAMGIPTLLLLPFFPDWRWMLDRSDSPWYPSFRLYRQSRPCDWEGVLERLLEDLR